jgi:hypothetical protein
MLGSSSVAAEVAASEEVLSSMKLVKREEVSGGWRKLRYEELHCVCSSLLVIKGKVVRMRN